MRLFVLGTAFVLSLSLLTPTAFAKSASSLAGSWRGSGVLQPSNGRKERARCRVSISKASANSYNATMNCATSAGRVSQWALIRKAGGNRYTGHFHNAKYNAHGSIFVVGRGNSLSVTMRSNKGSGWLRLHR